MLHRDNKHIPKWHLIYHNCTFAYMFLNEAEHWAIATMECKIWYWCLDWFCPIFQQTDQQEYTVMVKGRGEDVENKNTLSSGREKQSTVTSPAPSDGKPSIWITRCLEQNPWTAFSSIPVQTGSWKNSRQPCVQIQPQCIAEGYSLRHNFHKYNPCIPMKKHHT